MKPNGEEGSDSSGYGSTIYATPAATLLLKENVSLSTSKSFWDTPR